MRRFAILHRTYYNFLGAVQLGPHSLRLRPKENHELRIESSSLSIQPQPASLRWHRDVEDNSVAVAAFDSSATQLTIESEMIVQQYNQDPLDFWVEDYAMIYPFAYIPADIPLLSPYRECVADRQALRSWLEGVFEEDEPLQTYTLLERLNRHIQHSMEYQIREEPGVQSAEETLSLGVGSCRDFACLFMEAARHLGLAARFVSGYLHAEPSTANFGATHAWAEVYLPGAGWKGFDPTLGEIVGPGHFAVAVARLPESVPPVEGSFVGPPGANLDVGVWVTEL